jgi:hypothetical protein
MRRGLLLGLVVVTAACAFAPVSPETIERIYSTGLYPPIQRMVTPMSNLLPVALFDLLTVGAAVLLIGSLARGMTRTLRARRAGPLLAALVRVGAVAAVVYLLFLGLWGFNYRRVAMADRLMMAEGAPSSEGVVTLGLEAVTHLNALHANAHAVGWENPPWTNQPLRAAFAEVQALLSDAPLAVPGRLKRSLYGTYFRWTAVDGMVNPFALEVLANPDLLPFERTFVAAHEWAHLAGYADESEANFAGWLTCLHADVPAQYSGWLYLYWQISGEVSAADRARLAAALAPGPRHDIEAIVERIRRGQLPRLRNASWLVYDQYLRANRVEEGIRSYGLVVTLILRARFEDGWTPVRRGQPASSR